MITTDKLIEIINSNDKLALRDALNKPPISLDIVNGTGTKSLGTPLLAAVMKGDRYMITMLFRAGADVNMKDRNGHSALYILLNSSEHHKKAGTARILLEHNVDQKEIIKCLQLNMNANFNHLLFDSKRLIEQSFLGADKARNISYELENVRDAMFFQAALIKDLGRLAELLDGGADPNRYYFKAPTGKRSYPFTYYLEKTSYNGKTDLMQKFIKSGAFVNKDAHVDDVAPLHVAFASDSIARCMYLLEDAGIDPSLSDNDGNTALHHAAMSSKLVMIEAMCKQSSKNAIANYINVRNIQGLTALDILCNAKLQNSALLLMQHGARPHDWVMVAGHKISTPFLKMLSFITNDTSSLLLDYLKPLFVQDRDQEMLSFILMNAVEHHRKEVVSLLLSERVYSFQRMAGTLELFPTACEVAVRQGDHELVAKMLILGLHHDGTDTVESDTEYFNEMGEVYQQIPFLEKFDSESMATKDKLGQCLVVQLQRMVDDTEQSKKAELLEHIVGLNAESASTLLSKFMDKHFFNWIVDLRKHLQHLRGKSVILPSAPHVETDMVEKPVPPPNNADTHLISRLEVMKAKHEEKLAAMKREHAAQKEALEAKVTQAREDKTSKLDKLRQEAKLLKAQIKETGKENKVLGRQREQVVNTLSNPLIFSTPAESSPHIIRGNDRINTKKD